MKKQLLVLLPILLLGSVSYSQTLTDSLKAYYPFDANANDMSGNGNDGVVNGATLTTDRFGNPNSAYFFDGVSANIELPNDFDYMERTTLLWFNATTIGTTLGTMYDCTHPSLTWGRVSFMVQEVMGEKELQYRPSPTGSDLPGLIEENQWYMVTIVNTVDSSFCYLCDSLVYSEERITDSSASSGNDFASFGKTRINDRFFHGKVDDARIYNRALSQSEIQTLCEITLSTQETDDHEFNVKMYPNPASEQTTFEFDNTEQETHTITLYDTQGRLVKTIDNITTNKVIIDTKGLTKGLYFVHLNKGQQRQFSGKLTIK